MSWIKTSERLPEVKKYLEVKEGESITLFKRGEGMKIYTKTKLILETEEDVLSLRAGDVVHFNCNIDGMKRFELNDNPKIYNGNHRFEAWANGYNIDFDLGDIKKVIRWEER